MKSKKARIQVGTICIIKVFSWLTFVEPMQLTFLHTCVMRAVWSVSKTRPQLTFPNLCVLEVAGVVISISALEEHKDIAAGFPLH